MFQEIIVYLSKQKKKIMANKNKETTVVTVEYVATAKISYRNCYGEIAVKKGQKCTFSKFDEGKYKENGTVNFVEKSYYRDWDGIKHFGSCTVYKNIPATVKKVTTKVTTITEVTEEEI